jgi:hypothetical protein
MARAFRALDVLSIGGKAIEESAEQVADLNRQQLRAGVDGSGNRLQTYRSRGYANRKARMNPAAGYGNPDLYVTGNYHRNLQAKVEGNTLRIFTTDPDSVKVESLLKKYGGKEFGLTTESIRRYRKQTLYPLLAREIATRTGAGLKRN